MWQGVCVAGGFVAGGVCVAGGMHGRGTCDREGACVTGRHACRRDGH